MPLEMTPEHLRTKIVESSPLKGKGGVPVNKRTDMFDVSTELSGFGLQGVQVTEDELRDLVAELGLDGDEAGDLVKGLSSAPPAPEKKMSEPVSPPKETAPEPVSLPEEPVVEVKPAEVPVEVTEESKVAESEPKSEPSAQVETSESEPISEPAAPVETPTTEVETPATTEPDAAKAVSESAAAEESKE